MTVVGVLSETPQGLGDFGCFSNGAKFKMVHNSTCDKQIIIDFRSNHRYYSKNHPQTMAHHNFCAFSWITRGPRTRRYSSFRPPVRYFLHSWRIWPKET
jgi:hypothetical protein